MFRNRNPKHASSFSPSLPPSLFYCFSINAVWPKYRGCDAVKQQEQCTTATPRTAQRHGSPKLSLFFIQKVSYVNTQVTCKELNRKKIFKFISKTPACNYGKHTSHLPLFLFPLCSSEKRKPTEWMALCPVGPKATYYPPLCLAALLEVGIISKKPSKIYAVKPSWNNSQHFLSPFLPSFLWGTGDLRYYISFRYYFTDAVNKPLLKNVPSVSFRKLGYSIRWYPCRIA